MLFILWLLPFISAFTLPQNLWSDLAQQRFLWSKSAPVATSELTVDFDAWRQTQYFAAWEYLLANIGNSSTCTDKNIAPGVIVASPSKIQPDYYYQWTRDSALTIRTLIHYLQDYSFNDTGIQLLVEQYIWTNHHLQRLTTFSGNLTTGGLGEPKFQVNNTAFNAKWGRPQSDGPGLRVTSISNYMTALSDVNQDFLTNLNNTFIYHEIVKPDLEYIVQNWQKDSFDLWEEINSIHYFTSITQLKGLFDGIALAKQYDSQEFVQLLQGVYGHLKDFVEHDFISGDRSHLIESPKLYPKQRSGLDAAVLLGSLHAHEMVDEIDREIPFDVTNHYLTNHLLALLNDMKVRYPINHNTIGVNLGAGIGRYPEDVYDGYGSSEGNPWFISTATASEIVYKIIYKLINNKQDLFITKKNEEFFKHFINTNTGDEMIIIPYGSEVFGNLLQNLFSFSDSFLDVIKQHVDTQGHVSEQFNKYHGFMQGARDLTWSYSSILNAFRWREKTFSLLNSTNK